MKRTTSHTTAIYGILMSVSAAILILALVAAATLAWFSKGSSTLPQNFDIGQVSWRFTKTGTDLFKTNFTVPSNIMAGEEDESNPADSIVGFYYGLLPITSTEENPYPIPQDTPLTLSVLLACDDGSIPTNSIKWSSSDEDVVIVTEDGGILFACGCIDETAMITIVVRDSTRQEELTASLYVVVTAPPSTNDSGFLPGEKNVLRRPVTIANLSNVASKVRLKISYEFLEFNSDYEDENPRTKYDVETLFAGWSNPLIAIPDTISIPISVVKSDSELIHVLTPDSLISIGNWAINTLSLTTEEKSMLDAAILARDLTGFTFIQQMFDSADIIYYYDNTANPVTANYGSTVQPQELTDGVAFVDQIITASEFDSFSTRKMLTLKLTLQARQATAFNVDGGEWFDVYGCEYGTEVLPENTSQSGV